MGNFVDDCEVERLLGWMDAENGQRCGRPRLSRLGQLRSAFRLHPSSTPSDHRRRPRPSTHSLSSVTHAHASPHSLSLYPSHARLSEFAPNCELTSPRWPDDRHEAFPKAKGSREEQHRTNWAVVNLKAGCCDCSVISRSCRRRSRKMIASKATGNGQIADGDLE